MAHKDLLAKTRSKTLTDLLSHIMLIKMSSLPLASLISPDYHPERAPQRSLVWEHEHGSLFTELLTRVAVPPAM